MKQGYIVLYNVMGSPGNYCSPIDLEVETLDASAILVKLLEEVCSMHFHNTGNKVGFNHLSLVSVTKVYETDKKSIITDIQS